MMGLVSKAVEPDPADLIRTADRFREALRK